MWGTLEEDSLSSASENEFDTVPLCSYVTNYGNVCIVILLLSICMQICNNDFVFLRPVSMIVNVPLFCVMQMQETSLTDYFSSTFPGIIEIFVKFGGDYVGTMVRLIPCQRYALFILRLKILLLIW